MKKKVIIVVSLIGVVTLMLGVYLIWKNKKIANNFNYSSNGIAIMIDENGDGEYKPYSSSDGLWPDENYVIDVLSSTCDVGEDKGLGWDSKSNAVTLTMGKSDKCTIYFTKKVKDYDYKGNVQEFIAPLDGSYQIELWGASGGSADTCRGGNGAYTKGTISLKAGEKIYVYVGEAGMSGTKNIIGIYRGGYNGGADGRIGRANCEQTNSGGGGATDIRLDNGDGNWSDFDSLKSRIMVAAGGGGAFFDKRDTEMDYSFTYGGAAGGLKGFAGNIIARGTSWGTISPTGGTQTSGGQSVDNWISMDYSNKYIGKFGQADSSSLYEITKNGEVSYSGGGGGYYGGATGGWHAGGGGSSYISGYKGCVAIKENSTQDSVLAKDNCDNGTKDIKCSYHYSNKIFTDSTMIDGDSQMPSPKGENETGHSGNGYARISFISSEKAIDLSGNNYDGLFNGGATIKKDGSNGYGLYFDGNDNSFVELPTLPASINWSDGFSYEFEAKWEAFNSFARVFDFGNGASSDNILFTGFITNNWCYPSLFVDTTAYEDNNIGTTLNLDEKYKIRVEYKKISDSKYSETIYLDGNQLRVKTYDGKNIKNIDRTKNYIGKSNWEADAFFKGYIYWLKITDASGKPIIWYDFTKQ